MHSDRSQPLLDHLEELRRRLLVVVAAVGIGFFISLAFIDPIIHFFARFTGGFIYVHPTEALFVRLKIALLMGAYLAIPVFIYQIWKFVGAGLTPEERKSTFRLIPLSYLLFSLGFLLAWLVVLPAALKFLMGFSNADVRPYLSIDAFVSFAGWLAVGFGVMFQLPLVIILMVKFQFVSAKSLAHYRPFVVVGLALLSALLTPGPDLFSQLALLIPSLVLFEISLMVSKRMETKRR